MRIIGLCGEKGSGKNFVATRTEMIVKAVDGDAAVVVQAAFADPIKQFLIEILGLRKEILYGNDKDKKTLTQYRWEQMPHFANKEGKVGKMSAREVMQIFGTDFIRNWWGQDVWTMALQRKVVQINSEVDFFVVTDVRFPDEGEAIRSWGGEVWLVKGPQKDSSDQHSSEFLVSKVEFDKTIDNDYQSKLTIGIMPLLHDDLSMEIRKALGARYREQA